MVTKKDLETKLSNQAQWKRSVVADRVRQLQQCRGTLDCPGLLKRPTPKAALAFSAVNRLSMVLFV